MPRFLSRNAVIQKITDPYVGKVFGNVLDQYATPTYNIRLYMMNDTLTKQAKDEVSSPDESLAPKNPGDMVILAQTGVTAANIIDDVEIVTLSNANGPNATTVNFSIRQPGSATFIDEMRLAMKHLGMKPNVNPVFFLEIRFQGYTDDVMDEAGRITEEGGAPEVIAGPYRYKLALRNFDVAISAEGSEYNFTCASLQSFAFRRSVYKLPLEIATTGKTITEHIGVLQEELNNYYKNLADQEVPDEFNFDLSKLIKDPEAPDDYMTIKDDTLLTSDSQDAERLNRQMNEDANITDALERDAALGDQEPLENTGEAETIIEGDKITFPKDTSFESVFHTLLSMNDEVYSKITRSEDIEDPGAEVKKENAFVSWFRLNASVELTDFDSSRNTYSYKYNYIPVLYKNTNTTIAVQAEEQNIDEESAQTRLEQIIANGGVKKSYNYIFTGLNDQIKNLDIKYDSGVALLISPGYGSVGSFSVAESDKYSTTIPKEKSTDAAGKKEKEDQAGEKFSLDKIKSFFDEVKGAIDDVSNLANAAANTALSRLSELTGVDEDELKNIVTSGDDEALRTTIGKLDAETAGQLADQLGYDNVIDVQEVEQYDPEQSPYVYSADLLFSETYKDAEQLGYTKVEVGDALKDVQTKHATASSNPVKEATVKSDSVRNTLFGNIVEQHMQDRSFLLVVDMDIRGDPWYLGAPGLTESDEESADWYHNNNHFFLRIKAPEKFDPDWREEDANTGYWVYDGESRTFSGLYRFIKCKNSFVGGVYTTTVTANRIIGSALLKQIEADE